MGELPKGWAFCNLIEYVYSVPTGVPKFSGQRKYYSTGSINGKNHISEGEYSYNNRPSRANRIAMKDDVFQAKMQGTDKALLIQESLSDQLFSTGFLQLRPIDRTYDSKLLFYFIKSDYFLKQRDELATGSTQIALTDTKAVNLKLIIPPLNEQRRIVAKLEKLLHRVNACKERLDKIPAILKRFRQSVLAAAFTGELTNDWRVKNPDIKSAKELFLEIKKIRIKTAKNKRELNQILNSYEEKTQVEADLPKPWLACNIGQIGNVSNGSTPSRKQPKYWNGDIPWVSSGEVQNNIIYKTREKITQEGFDNSSVRWLPSGSVLIAMIGEGKTRGQTSILNLDATINQNIAAIILDHGGVVSAYLWYWFQFRYLLTRQEGSGSGPQALNCQRVRELPFHLAPLEEQKEIVQRIEIMYKKADKIEERYKKAKAFIDKLTQSILAKAFRGELVSQDPSDEPASELLRRIKDERAKREAEMKGRKKTVRKRAVKRQKKK